MDSKWFKYIKLKRQSCYKEDKGEDVKTPPLRLGKIEDNIYLNQKTVNTRYGNQVFAPTVRITVRTIENNKSYIHIEFINEDAHDVFKMFIIRSQPNELSLEQFSALYDNLLSQITEDAQLVDIIQYIRDLKDEQDNKYTIEEVGQ